MATIQLTTTNYNGEQGNVYFYPCNSGATNTNLGTMTFPTEIVDTENYEGTYQIHFTGLTSGNDQFCYVQIPCSGCNRPTGLTTTALWVEFNGTEFSSSANTACDVLTEVNNGNNLLSGNLTTQIGPDNKVYKTDILGDCSVIGAGYYIITDNQGNRVISIDSSGYYTDVDCVNLPTSTPTPTPEGPTATPTPTPYTISILTHQIYGNAGVANAQLACQLLTSPTGGFLYSYVSDGLSPIDGIVLYQTNIDGVLSGEIIGDVNVDSWNVITWDNGTKYVFKTNGLGEMALLEVCSSTTSTPTPTPAP